MFSIGKANPIWKWSLLFGLPWPDPRYPQMHLNVNLSSGLSRKTDCPKPQNKSWWGVTHWWNRPIFCHPRRPIPEGTQKPAEFEQVVISIQNKFQQWRTISRLFSVINAVKLPGCPSPQTLLSTCCTSNPISTEKPTAIDKIDVVLNSLKGLLLQVVKSRLTNACDVAHYGFTCNRLRKKFQLKDLPLSYQILNEPTTKEFIINCQNVNTYNPFVRTKTFLDKIPLHREVFADGGSGLWQTRAYNPKSLPLPPARVPKENEKRRRLKPFWDSCLWWTLIWPFHLLLRMHRAKPPSGVTLS